MRYPTYIKTEKNNLKLYNYEKEYLFTKIGILLLLFFLHHVKKK